MVDIHTELPDDIETLREQLLTSTTREDFRRIRKANFSYRVTTDLEAIREFHARHYAPLVAQQHPEDGRIASMRKMLGDLDHGGELVCADIDGHWVAGILNIAHDDRYALKNLGIRDADNSVRQKRVVAALIVRSLERAVELGQDRATLGRSLPFLGKGPVWFKAKWNGTVTRDPAMRDLHFFMDLRHDAVRTLLAASPVIHSEGNELVASTWLEPGEKPLQATVRDAGRFPGISRWYVLADSETLSAGSEQLASTDRVVPVSVSSGGSHPLWLGEVLPTSPG
ncbi:MAG: GNAT family N-acetyltransferase [Acidimicrobiia bacterium]